MILAAADMGMMLDWDDCGPTIEDEIRLNNELSPTGKKLLIQKSRVESYHRVLKFTLLILLLGAIGIIVRGRLAVVIDAASF